MKGKILWLFLLISSTTLAKAHNSNEDRKINLLTDIINTEKHLKTLSVVGCFDFNFINSILIKSSTTLSITFTNSPSELNKTTDTEWASQKLFITDFEKCPYLKEDFLSMDKYFLEHPFHWLFFIEMDDIPIFDKFPVLLASNVILAFNNGSNFNMIQVYKVRPSSQTLRIEKYGFWNESGLIDERETKILARRRKNLHEELLLVNTAMLKNDSFQYLYTYTGKSHDTAIRVCLAQMSIVIDTLNATIKFMLTEKIGYDETGIWVGAYGSIINGHVDIATTPYFPLLHRLHLLDYVDKLGIGRAYFIFRFPNLSSVANIYVLPFDDIVWICLFICAILCVIATYYILKFQQKFVEDSQKNTVSDVALMTFSAICQMGSEIEAKLLSSRIFYFFLYITFVFVYTSYTANIVALLQTPTKSIQTLEDLYNSKLKLGVEDNLYNRYYVGRTTDPIRLKIFREKIAPPDSPPKFMDLKTGVAQLRNSPFAFFAEGGPIYEEMEKTFFEGEKCNLNEIEFLEITEPYQALKKNSPFREIMKTNLPKLREFGIQQVEVNRMYTKRPQCVVSSGSVFESVSLESVRGAILLLPFGLVTALLLFAGEILKDLSVKRKIFTRNKIDAAIIPITDPQKDQE